MNEPGQNLPATVESLVGLNILSSLIVPSSIKYPEVTPEDQIRNTLGTIIANLGKNIEELGVTSSNPIRAAQLMGQLLGNHVAEHLSNSNLPRLDHHIFTINNSEVELRIINRKQSKMTLKYNMEHFEFDCTAEHVETDSGGLIFHGQDAYVITDESPYYMHVMNGFLQECGIVFTLQFYDTRIERTQTTTVHDGKYRVAHDTTHEDAFDPSIKEYPEIMEGLALGISQALRPLLPKEFQ